MAQSGLYRLFQHSAGNAAAHGTNPECTAEDIPERTRQGIVMRYDYAERRQQVHGRQQRHEPLNDLSGAACATEQNDAQQYCNANRRPQRRQGKRLLCQSGNGAALGHVAHA